VTPETDIPIAYRGVQVVLKSGQTVTGIRLNRDDLSIQVRDTRDNLRSFLMENVREIRFDKPSLMPAYASMDRKDSRRRRGVLELVEGGTMISTRAGAWTIAAILVTAASWTLSGQSAPVTSDRLLKAEQEPGNWLMLFRRLQRMAFQPP
jgi:hypothetical protein